MSIRCLCIPLELHFHQVQLKVYSEEDSRNAQMDGERLVTSKVAVKEFGAYVEELHANGNKPFREQFFVSAVVGVASGCDQWVCPLAPCSGWPIVRRSTR